MNALEQTAYDDGHEQRMIETCKRADAKETKAGWQQRRLAEARAVAGVETTALARTDGGEPVDSDDDLGPLHIGDHVTDREDPDATMVVVGLDTLQADAYELGDGGPTIADVNPEYPETDDVVEVVFPNKTDMDIDTKRYAYPRARLRLETPVHGNSVLERVFEQTVMNGNRSATEAEWLAEVLEDEFGGDVEEALEVAEAARFGVDDGGEN